MTRSGHQYPGPADPSGGYPFYGPPPPDYGYDPRSWPGEDPGPGGQLWQRPAEPASPGAPAPRAIPKGPPAALPAGPSSIQAPTESDPADVAADVASPTGTKPPPVA